MVRIYAIASAALATISCSSGGGDTAGSSGGRVVFQDSFDRAELGSDWLDTSRGHYTLKNGELAARGAHNKPLWLARALPRNARVEFSARSESPAIDIKAEVFGDGRSFAKRASYAATSYVIILGGWNNSRSIIARMDEHGKDRRVRTSPKGVTGKRYRFSISRVGTRVNWFLNGERFLELDDPQPLVGTGHDHFAFNNWESEVYFDDLVVYAL